MSKPEVIWRDILTYNSSVFVLNVKVVNTRALVEISDYMYKPISKTFVMNTQKEQHLQCIKAHNGRIRISCLGFKVILDRHCCVFLPYFVAQDGKNCYLFCLDSNCEWFMRYNFTIPQVLGKRIELRDTSYFIENGPTIIWTLKDEIFIYKAEYSLRPLGNILKISIDLTFDKGLVPASEILWWTSGDSEQGMIAVKDINGAITNSYHITVDNKKMEAYCVLNRKIIPFIYLTITSCAIVMLEQIPSIKDDFKKNSHRVFITTTQSQLLEFVDGKYVKHVNIPLPSCQNIRMFESPEGNLFLLCSQEGQICVVDWKNCKIDNTYQGFFKLLIDDFIGLGTLQAVLFYGSNQRSYGTLENFILTDFCKVKIEMSRENEKEEALSSVGCTKFKSQKEECHTRNESRIDDVLNALKRKLQVAGESIIECKMEKSEKYSFIKRHCERLSDMSINECKRPLLQSSGLAHLVDSQERYLEGSLEVQSPKLLVRSKWQDISSSDWIIGVEVENIGLRKVYDISLCIVNKTSGILVSSSKILRSESQTKEEVLSSGKKTTVIAVMSFPNFCFQNDFTVSVMLTWKHEDHENQSMFCGNIIVMDHVINKARSNCQYLLSSSLKTQMAVSSTSGDIANVVELLKSNIDTCEIHSSFPLMYHLRNALVDTHISWCSSRKVLIMDVFTRGYNELYMFLRLMSQQLPDNLTWSTFYNKFTPELAITLIEKEVRFRIGALNNLLKAQTTLKSDKRDNSIGEELQEVIVKRRKLSQHKHCGQNNSDQEIGSTICQKVFLDIYDYMCNTDDGFLIFLFLQNQSQVVISR